MWNLSSALSDASGNLVINYNGDGNLEGDIDGFQIQDACFKISAACDGTNVFISFVTQSGLSYQVQSKDNFFETNWTLLGTVSGNNTIQSLNDLAAGNSRFYRVQISTGTGPISSMLHTSGTNIVNASGSIIRLTGLNLGGWFIMEKWMCPLDSGSLPDTYSAITNLDRRFGVATEQALIRCYQTNWITTTDLNNITNAGYKFACGCPSGGATFSPSPIPPVPGWRPDAFTVLDWLVTNCCCPGHLCDHRPCMA